MSLQEPIRKVESARIELNRVAANTQGWSDGQRADFDNQRMKPLSDAGARMAAALMKAQEQCVAARRLLAE